MSNGRGLVSAPVAGEVDGLNSVGKALLVVDLLAETGGPITGSELARSAGLSKSTVFRLLSQLEHAGYVDREGPRFVIGRRLFEVGNSSALCQPEGLRELARPYMADLFVHPLISVSLAVRDGSEVLYIDKLLGTRSARSPATVGRRLPATCSAEGKAMLAFAGEAEVGELLAEPLPRLTTCSISQATVLADQLATIRTEGVAYDRQETSVGIVAVAAPIRQWGQVVGAISIAGPVGRFVPVSARAAVQRAAVAIGRSCADNEHAA